MTATKTTQADATTIANERGYKVEVYQQAGDCWDVRIYSTSTEYVKRNYNRKRDVLKANIGDAIMKMLDELAPEVTEATGTKTNGQQFADALRRVMHIGPRTRQLRKSPLSGSAKENVITEVLEAVINSNKYPGYYAEATTQALSHGWSAVCSWNKHVEGYRIDSTQRAYLTSLSPWQFTALLGEMVDAGITNVGQGERWLQARRDADIAAWMALQTKCA